MSVSSIDTDVPNGRFGVVLAVCLAALVLPLSFSGAAVGTPAIGRDLGGSGVALTWITNAFMLTFGSLLMTAGTLADRYGRKRIFVGGMVVFVAFSVLLALAQSVWLVDLYRAGQGIGAAAALAAGSAAMAQEFDGYARTRAFSMLGTTFGVGLAFGPVIAGWLIDQYGWRSIFLTGTAVGVLALAFGMPQLRESRDPEATTLDWPGVLTFTGALTLFTFGVIQAPESGWSSVLVIGLLGGAAAMIALFIIVENRVSRPMLELSLFRYPRFVGVQLLPIATGFAYVVLLIMLPLRFVGIEGRSEVEAGLIMAALSAPMIVVPSIAVTLTRRLSAGIVSGAGLLIAAAGLLWLGQITPADGMLITLPMLLIGLGAGFPWGLMDALSVTVVPKERAGMATGIFNTTKVASEGVTLATATAILAGLGGAGVARMVGSGVTASDDMYRDIGQRLATGDLTNASAIAPHIDRQILVNGYLHAFQLLTYGLAGVAVIAAIASFLLLSDKPRSV